MAEKYSWRKHDEKLKQLVSEGKTRSQIADSLGVDKSSVYYRIKALGLGNTVAHSNGKNYKSYMSSIDEDIKKLYNEGKTQKEIAKILNITRDTVAYHLKVLKLSSRDNINYFTEEEDYRIKQLRFGGHTVKEIADKLNRSRSSVHYRLKKLGLYGEDLDERTEKYREKLNLRKSANKTSSNNSKRKPKKTVTSKPLSYKWKIAMSAIALVPLTIVAALSFNRSNN